jgi:hypothetical protein
MSTIAIMFVVGTLLGLVGVILTDVYERHTFTYRFCRGLSILGVLAVGVGLLMYLSAGFGPSERTDCERLGGLYVEGTACVDVSKLPTIQLPDEAG